MFQDMWYLMKMSFLFLQALKIGKSHLQNLLSAQLPFQDLYYHQSIQKLHESATNPPPAGALP